MRAVTAIGVAVLAAASAAAQTPATASECGPWELLAPLPQSRALRAVASAGTEFVAVGDGVALHSVDEMTWTVTTLPGVLLNAVASDGRRWVAVGNAGIILWSDDGRTWTAADSPSVGDLLGVTCGRSGWVAVGDQAQLRSDDGLTWVSGSADAGKRYVDVVSTVEGYVRWAYNSQFEVSSDGTTWRPLAARLNMPWDGKKLAECRGRLVVLSYSSAFDISGTEPVELGRLPFVPGALTCLDGVLVATGSTDYSVEPRLQVVMASLDGEHWSIEAQWRSAATLLAIGGGGSGIVAVGEHGRIVASREGQPWEAASGDAHLFTGVATDGVGFVASSADPACRALASADGRTWRCRSGGAEGFGTVFWSGETYVAQEVPTGRIFVSTDGQTWSVQSWVPSTPEAPGWPLEVWAGTTWNGTSLVVGGDSYYCRFPSCPPRYGLVAARSSDGDWREDIRLSPGLRTLARSDSRLVSNCFACPLPRSWLSWSNDGVLWHPAQVTADPGSPIWPPEHTLAVWTGEEFVAAGGTRVLRSDDGEAWADIGVLPGELLDLDWTGRALVAVGHADNRSLVMESADGAEWTVHDPGIAVQHCWPVYVRHDAPADCGLTGVAATPTVQVAVGGAGALLRRECASRTGAVRRTLGRAGTRR